ncbi:hypothetical protein [Tenacibaculum agarivorans]|uniref:hypothetical protein n=1 Tax=Tenacibaculum agarivorans TaxID=1908389 RepID=UPI00094B82DA|nr:hypothetical protein [Tenacibaculum agarivorans]
MRKTTFLKLLLVLTLALLSSCRTQEKKEETKVATEIKQGNTAVPSIKNDKETATFNFKPQKPVQGKLKAVVELGASGFNSFIIEVDKDKNWEAKRKEFGNSLILEELTNTKEVNAKLKSYIQKILEFGVNPKDVHFVISSGADQKTITKTVKKELKKIGYVVNVVTAEEEGQYALKSAMPKCFEETAFVVDIGSGNTKIAYLDGNKIISKETHGAKYFQKNIDASKVYKEANKIASEVPQTKRVQSFIIGGVPYQMAKTLRKGNERFTILNKDITTYAKLAEQKGRKVASGLTIFKAINDQTNPSSIIFDWDANFTIGYLLNLPY